MKQEFSQRWTLVNFRSLATALLPGHIQPSAIERQPPAPEDSHFFGSRNVASVSSAKQLESVKLVDYNAVIYILNLIIGRCTIFCRHATWARVVPSSSQIAARKSLLIKIRLRQKRWVKVNCERRSKGVARNTTSLSLSSTIRYYCWDLRTLRGCS